MSELLGIARFQLHDGRLAEFERLSARCMEIVRTQDTGTLHYDIFFNDDRSESIVVSRFRDHAAQAEHVEHLGAELSEAILATGKVEVFSPYLSL